MYAIGSNDDAIAEFTRNADGSLTQIGCIADTSSDWTGAAQTARRPHTDSSNPQAIAISPDGKNVYVAAEDASGNGDIAEFTRGRERHR